MKKAYAILLAVIFTVTAAIGLFAFPNRGSTVEIWISGYGPITVALEEDTAQRTVRHFRKTVRDGAYDGAYLYGVAYGITTFFGNPEAQKNVAPVTGEFAANGYGNGAHFGSGTVYLRRESNDYNSGRAAFCICLSDEYGATLNGLYAAFGQVTDGLEIVAELSALQTDESGVPQEKVMIESIEFTDKAFLTERSLVWLGISLLAAVSAVFLWVSARRDEKVKKEGKK